MIYLIISIFIILLIILTILNTLFDKVKKSNKILEELTVNIIEINQLASEYHNKKLKAEQSSKRVVKKINVDYSDKSYMTNLYGYIEQTKLFWINQILAEIEKLPYKNNVDFIKRYYLLMFTRMMEENNLKFSDFKIEDTYGGAGPSARYYINFELKDAKYYGFDKWVSEAILIVQMSNGETREFKVESYMNNLEDYFQTESEYEKVHFFDALNKVYSEFTFDDESYYLIGGMDNNKYTFVINDLIQQYIDVGKKWNVYFDTSVYGVDDLPWSGEVDDVLKKTAVIDDSWSVNEYDDVKVLDYASVAKERQKIFEVLLKSNDGDDKFKLATMYYYAQYDYDFRKEDDYNQQQAIKIWKNLANDGHAYSQLVLGILYYDGIYVLKNFSKAKKYVELAYDNGFEKPAKKVWDELKLYDY